MVFGVVPTPHGMRQNRTGFRKYHAHCGGGALRLQRGRAASKPSIDECKNGASTQVVTNYSHIGWPRLYAKKKAFRVVACGNVSQLHAWDHANCGGRALRHQRLKCAKTMVLYTSPWSPAYTCRRQAQARTASPSEARVAPTTCRMPSRRQCCRRFPRS